MSEGAGRKRISEPLQYSLRTLMLLVAFAAVFCLLLTTATPLIGFMLWLIVTLALPSVLTTGLVYGNRQERIFCIGALFPACSTLLAMSIYLGSTASMHLSADQAGYAGWYMCGSFVISVVVGAGCVSLRMTLERQDR
jgi:hypothetical protein